LVSITRQPDLLADVHDIPNGAGDRNSDFLSSSCRIGLTMRADTSARKSRFMARLAGMVEATTIGRMP
jgi:hypothetical protein